MPNRIIIIRKISTLRYSYHQSLSSNEKNVYNISKVPVNVKTSFVWACSFHCIILDNLQYPDESYYKKKLDKPHALYKQVLYYTFEVIHLSFMRMYLLSSWLNIMGNCCAILCFMHYTNTIMKMLHGLVMCTEKLLLFFSSVGMVV